MSTILRSVAVLSLLSFWAGITSAHADSFAPMPALDSGSKHLEIRWVEYNGGTNGKMIVEVKNNAMRPTKFEADGLFFVPHGDPEKAPQRLGASGPFLLLESVSGTRLQRAWKEKGAPKEMTMLAPGQTKRIALEVFCIDSHRSSPNSTTKFNVADQRLPKNLRRELKSSNQAIYRKYGGDTKKAKGEVQGNMWKTRDKNWIKLQGERAREKAATPLQNQGDGVEQRQIQRRR